MPSATVEEYLECIYKISIADPPVRAVRLAEQMKVSAASVAEMMRKLVNQGLVVRSEDMAISLTDEGRIQALSLLRRHRLSERFLTDLVGLPWDQVHDEACRFEHVLSPEVEAGLDRLLNHPKTCPHGYPIPDQAGRIADESRKMLIDCQVGDECMISRVPEEDAELLRYLDGLGLKPDVKVNVVSFAPFNGPVHIRVGEAEHAIGRDLAARLAIKSALP